MNKKINFLIYIVLIPVITINAQKITTEQYIDRYYDLAIQEMNRLGIPASITIAQGILESGSGNSALARKSKNHFGIKCHNNWDGGRVYHNDDKENECFRKYNKVYDSYIDHSNFLASKDRYAFLFDLNPKDYKGWAKGLKKAGYATNPKYAHSLIRIIERYDLHRFDDNSFKEDNYTNKSRFGKNSKDNFFIDAYKNHKIKYNNGIKYVDTKEGDTFDIIAKEFGLKEWEIFTYNDLPKSSKITNFKRLYLQRKRNKAHRSHRTYVVKNNETLFYISHKYGVKLKRLKKYNKNISPRKPLKNGTIIQLRKRKK